MEYQKLMITYVGHIDRGRGPVCDIGDVRDRPAKPDFDIVGVCLKDCVDCVVARELDQGILATELEGVEDVWSIVKSSSERLSSALFIIQRWSMERKRSKRDPREQYRYYPPQ